MHGNEIHILAAIVNYKTNLKLPRVGLCSSWLATLALNDRVIIQIKKGSFTFPSDKVNCGFLKHSQIFYCFENKNRCLVFQNIPVIMVGPGTGIAPFRSFALQQSVEGDSAKNYIVFGCRNKEADFYFQDEWVALKNSGKIELFTAFSRQQENKV